MNFKKTFLFAVAVAASGSVFSQQWLGTGPIYNNPLTASVGIGTSTPSAALNVATTGAVPFFVQRTSGQVNGIKLFFSSNPATGITVGSGTSVFQNTAATSDILFMPTPTTPGLVIKANTYVGVGTTAPVANFQVKGNSLFSSIASGSPASAAYIVGNTALSTQTNPDYTWFGNTATGIFHPAANVIGFTANNVEAMRISPIGFTGFNTTAPLFRAHVNGDLFVTGTGGGSYGTLGSAGGATMYLGDTDTQPQWGIEYDDANITTGSMAGGINFWRPFGSTGTGGNYVLFLKNDSKVGIHTNNPTADLTVNGNMLVGDPATVTLPAGYKLYVQTGILTEKVKVALTSTSDWADYVFEKEYKLRSLEEVSTFVQSNKHLPGVPSASELKEQGGIDLGKMDAKLLEKIEELTLYIIQINKEKNELADRLTKLESSK